MSNAKHTAAAICAVLTVFSLSIAQMNGTVYVKADGKTAGDEYVVVNEEVSAITPAFSDYEYFIRQSREVAAAKVAKAEMEAMEAYEDKTAYVSYSNGSVNVRAEASKESEIVGRLRFSDSLTVTGIKDDWSRVTLNDGTVGFVMSDLLTFDYEAIEAELLSTTMYECGVVSVNGSLLNVRNQPDETNSFVMGQVEDGSVVYIIEKSENGWYKIYYGADYDIGYAMSDFITIDSMVSREQIAEERKERLNSIAKKGYIVTNADFINVRVAPSEKAEVLTTVKNGDTVTVISQGSKWTKIITASSKIAYITSSAVLDDKSYNEYKKMQQAAKEKAESVENKNSEQKKSETDVAQTKNNSKDKAESKSKSETNNKAENESQKDTSAKSQSNSDDQVKNKTAENKQNNATKQTKTNEAVKSEAESKQTESVAYDSSVGSKIISEAEKYLGTKYVYGGSSPSGFDCSGLVQYTMKKVGIKVNRSSRDQYKNGVGVARENLMPGDLVFFSKGGSISHVGIYAGNDKVIHSPQAGQSVCYTTLSHMCSYSTYVGARRVY